MAIDYAYNFKGASGQGNQLKFTGALNFASSNWTVEAFIKLPSSFFATATSIDLFGSWSAGVSNSRICFGLQLTSAGSTTNIYPFFWTGGTFPTGTSNTPSTYPAPYNFVANKWYHIAVTRSGSSFYLHVNGTREASGTCTGSMPNPGLWMVNGHIDFVTEANGGNVGNISISNHRVVIGTALYTGATYTVPTSTLTAIAGTVLLTGTQGTIYDNSANHYPFVNSLVGSETTYVIPTAYGPFSDDVVSETLSLSDTTTATLNNEGTILAQRFTSAGVLQIPGTFDEYGPSNGSDSYTDAIASYPSTVTSTSLSYSGTPGIFTWTCPPGVTNVSVVCVGGGGAGGAGGGSGGGGGGLGYKNNITVVPGQTYTVVAGAGGAENLTSSVNSGGDSYFISTSIVKGGGGGGGLVGGALRAGGAGGTYVGDGGGNGGAGGSAPGTRYDGSQSSAGGGAGGYSGNGGVGSNGIGSPSSAGGNPASGSGGGGGGSNGRDSIYGFPYSAGGGGVGLLGKGSDGSGGAADNSNAITGGKGGIGGSGGETGGIPTGDLAPYGGISGNGRGGYGGLYGGGGGAGQGGGGAGGAGAVRIVWNTPASTVFPNASGITWPDSRLTSEGNLFTKSSLDEYTLNPSRTSPTSGTTLRKETVSSYQIYDSFDEVSLEYTITPDKKILNEGDTVTYTINAPLSKVNTLYYTNVGTTAAADFSGGLVYGVTPLTWSGTATATLWSFTGITQSATSGSGTGAVFSIRKNNATTTMGTFGVLTVIPTSPGSGYQIGDTITIAGASLGLTTPTNNLTITVGSDWFAQAVYSATITGTGLAAVSGTPGSFNWTCPDGVYRISIAAVGGGGGAPSGVGVGGGGGGALGYNTDYAVVPGTVYPVVAGIGGAAGVDGGTSYFTDNLVGALFYAGGGQSAGPGGTASSGLSHLPKYSGFVGFSGGAGGGGAASPAAQGGGGGAGGFTAAGGAGGFAFGATGGGTGSLLLQLGKNSASGGGGGSSGGGAGVLDSVGTAVNTSTGNGGGGGGTLLLGVSNLGVGGVNLAGSSGAILGQSGQGGSGGAAGGAASATVGGAGGAFGGGGGGGSTTGGAGGAGALRIIWNYPHGFLPSTTALTAVDGTKLLTAQSPDTQYDLITNSRIVANIPPATWTASTTNVPFAGTYSWPFNGTSQNVTVPNSTDFAFGSGDFTIEGWFTTTTPTSTQSNGGVIYKRTSFAGVGFGLSTLNPGKLMVLVSNSTGTAWSVLDDSVSYAVDTWYHFAITKTGGNVYFYLNGTLRVTAAHTTAIFNDATAPLTIGSSTAAGNYHAGNISNIRVIKGTALYSPALYPTGFTPSTTPLTVVTNTKLLTLQAASVYDATGINTLTSPATGTFGTSTTIIPFAGTYSWSLNGTTQYAYVPHSSNFVFGATDDFTIEGYLYTSATTINKGLIYKRSGSNISGVNFGTSTTTASRFTLKVANDTGSAWTVNDETAGTFAINTWYHFAITKTNGVIYLYINGLLTRQYAHTTAIYDDGSALNIGQDPGGGRWVGNLSNIRIIKGTALYYPPSTIVKRNFPDYPSVVQNSGSIPITNGTGTLALTVGQDILQEGVQDIQIQLRSGSTSGPVLATAPTVVVADTSRPLAIPGGGQCWCAYPDYVSGPNLVYTGTPGVFTFTAPKGYTAVSAVAIGAGGAGGYNGGGGGGGGALAYSASIAVTAGTTYTITCGAPGTTNGGTSSAGGASSFASNVIANGGQPGGGAGVAGAGGTVGAGTGFAGGAGGAGSGTYSGGGGGGAGGYTAVGGAGGAVTGTWPTLTAASGASSATGGAGGGAGGSATAGAYFAAGGGGGGTSPFGSVAVASIAGIAYAGTYLSAGRGGGGSGGNPTTTASGVQLGEKGYTSNLSTPYQQPNGGRFGGGGGGGDGNGNIGGDGGPGCVRIIWGTGRAYPSTLTADRVSGYPAAAGNPTGQQ